MREIKFNAVDEDTGEYVRFDDFISKLKKENAFGYIEYRSDDTYNELLAKFLEYYYGYKLLQYTGLKDKNGVEIFEGDILKVKLSKPSYFDDNIGKVYFRNGCFTITSVDISDDTFIYFPKSRCIEVIGNIYENKELLNGN